jgi:hypothetical protein
MLFHLKYPLTSKQKPVTIEYMEIVNQINIPIIADSVLSPELYYGGEYTGIYFITDNEKHGRITFENMDSIRICRGEVMPYKFDWQLLENYNWIFQIENSKWLLERFGYEKKHYGSSYEFGGNVNEMLTDFKHYLFSFHDEFIEVIARGFWFEEDENNLFKVNLKKGHPFLLLSKENMQKFEYSKIIAQIRINQSEKDTLIKNAQYCSQKLYEFALELEGTESVDRTVLLSYRNNELISVLRSYFGKQIAEFNGVVPLEQVKPYIEKYMEEVYERRRAMGKSD